MFLRNKILFYFLICSVFGINFLILLNAPGNFGFGNIYITLFGLLLTFIGLLLWFLGFITLGKSFSLFPKAKAFIKNGIYHYFKHPIYIGMSLAFVGISLGKGTILGLLFTLLVTTPLNFWRAKKEEEILRKKFKTSYS